MMASGDNSAFAILFIAGG